MGTSGDATRKSTEIPCGNEQLFLFFFGLCWALNSSHLWFLISDWFRPRKDREKDEMLYFWSMNYDVLFIVEKITKWMNWDSWIPSETWSLQEGSFFTGFNLTVSARAQHLYIKMISEKDATRTLPVWFESETLHVSVVGVWWKYSADRIRSNSISLDSNHAGWWIFKQGWKRSLYGAWNLFDETHPHCDWKWEGDSLCLLAWWCLVPSAHTTAPSLYSASTYVVVVV